MKFMLSIWFLSVSGVLFGQQNEFGWLVGTWQENEKSFEAWTYENGLLSGTAYQLDRSSGKEITTEQIKLLKRGNDFYYVPDVAGPQGPVEFRITSFDTNSFTAENPDHDFPKKIVYKKTGEVLEATISGPEKSIRYTFKKIR